MPLGCCLADRDIPSKCLHELIAAASIEEPAWPVAGWLQLANLQSLAFKALLIAAEQVGGVLRLVQDQDHGRERMNDRRRQPGRRAEPQLWPLMTISSSPPASEKRRRSAKFGDSPNPRGPVDVDTVLGRLRAECSSPRPMVKRVDARIRRSFGMFRPDRESIALSSLFRH